MHISEGILSGTALAIGWAGTLAGTYIGLKHTDPEKIVKTALLTSGFFLASLINVRFGPVATHLTLMGVMGLILGWSIFPAVLVALFLQAVLFQFGGLIVLGVNTLNMALPGLIVYLIFRGKNLFNYFMAGFISVILGGIMLSLFLWKTDENFINIIKIIMTAHIPLAILEGVITIFINRWFENA